MVKLSLVLLETIVVRPGRHKGALHTKSRQAVQLEYALHFFSSFPSVVLPDWARFPAQYGNRAAARVSN